MRWLLDCKRLLYPKNEWRDPEVNAVNRAPMHANYFAYESYDAARTGVKEESDNFLSLNGMWKFNWVRNADQRPDDFISWVIMIVRGMN